MIKYIRISTLYLIIKHKTLILYLAVKSFKWDEDINDHDLKYVNTFYAQYINIIFVWFFKQKYKQ
jgi:hypothetical protein